MLVSRAGTKPVSSAVGGFWEIISFRCWMLSRPNVSVLVIPCTKPYLSRVYTPLLLRTNVSQPSFDFLLLATQHRVAGALQGHHYRRYRRTRVSHRDQEVVQKHNTCTKADAIVILSGVLCIRPYLSRRFDPRTTRKSVGKKRFGSGAA